MEGVRVRNRHWTKEKIIEVIRGRAAERRSLAARATRCEDPRLFGAASHHFGNWGSAVKAAGFDYQRILLASKQETVMRRRPRGYWDTPKILEAIRERAREGKPLNSFHAQVEDGPLVSSATRHLGSWERAVELATGIPYQEIRLNQPWSREEVVEALRSRHVRGEILKGSQVLQEAGQLYNAARVWFGSWKEAVEAAGLDYLEVATSWKWNEERIFEALHEWAASGQAGFPRELEGSVLARYGSWAKALEAAGLDPSLAETRSLRHTWTKEEVLEAIRERVKCGKGLLHSDVRREDVRLLEAARRLFGTWVKARAEALSVEPRRVRRWPPGAKAP